MQNSLYIDEKTSKINDTSRKEKYKTYVEYYLRLKSMKQNRQIPPIKYSIISESQLVNT